MRPGPCVWGSTSAIGAGPTTANVALAVQAEQLGFSSVWAAEAYGSDAATVLA